MRKGFANSTSSRWNADTSERTSKFTSTRLYSSSAHPEPIYEGTSTDNCTYQAVFDAGAVPSQFGLGNSGTPSLVNLCIYLQNTVVLSMVRNLPCSTCVISDFIHWKCSQYCYPRLFLFSLAPNARPASAVCNWKKQILVSFLRMLQFNTVHFFTGGPMSNATTPISYNTKNMFVINEDKLPMTTTAIYS